jgi:hypothetical protein
MIYLGYEDNQKREIIARYIVDNDIEKTVVISGDKFPLPIPDTDQVAYSDVIMYVTFYRLLQEITQKTLIVINESLRTQNRYDLAYNCIRNYLNMTGHQLIFQYLPQIDTQEDFMILFDFDTKSRWKRRPFDPYLVGEESQVSINDVPVKLVRVPVKTSPETKQKYMGDRKRLFEKIGNKDPHTIPRNLYLIGGKDKRAYVDANSLPMFGEVGLYVARNKRLGRDNIVTYAEAEPGKEYTILELPHRFIDFSDFMRQTGQAGGRVLVADLKVDDWYFIRYQEWSERIHETYASLLR